MFYIFTYVYIYTYICCVFLSCINGSTPLEALDGIIAKLKPIPVFKKKFSQHFWIEDLKNRTNQCEKDEKSILDY